MSHAFKHIAYGVERCVACVTLNRPAVYNAINLTMTSEIEQAVKLANDDSSVKAIVVTGAGAAFSSGFDLKQFAESERGTQPGSQKMPWCPYEDYRFMAVFQQQCMSLWHSLKPTVAKINGVCVGGGSDIALCCDLTFMADEATIGYPPSRLWGSPVTAMWFYRLGAEKAKRMLFTGRVLTGQQALSCGLIGDSVPLSDLDQVVDDWLDGIRTVPQNQLFLQKQVINNAVEMTGLGSSQRLACFMDGMTRHTPEGVAFQEQAFAEGFKVAIATMRKDAENIYKSKL